MSYQSLISLGLGSHQDFLAYPLGVVVSLSVEKLNFAVLDEGKNYVLHFPYRHPLSFLDALDELNDNPRVSKDLKVKDIEILHKSFPLNLIICPPLQSLSE